jgi:hypothetical protein
VVQQSSTCRACGRRRPVRHPLLLLARLPLASLSSLGLSLLFPCTPCCTLQVAFPNAALCGFFCNGEIGPTPADELSPTHSTGGEKRAHMMGYSTGVRVACGLVCVACVF